MPLCILSICPLSPTPERPPLGNHSCFIWTIAMASSLTSFLFISPSSSPFSMLESDYLIKNISSVAPCTKPPDHLQSQTQSFLAIKAFKIFLAFACPASSPIMCQALRLTSSLHPINVNFSPFLKQVFSNLGARMYIPGQ